MTPLEKDLRAALAEFGPNGERWVPCCPYSFSDQNCAITACGAASPGPDHVWRRDAMLAALRSALSGYGGGIAEWNDSHTWPEVKALFERAIAEAA